MNEVKKYDSKYTLVFDLDGTLIDSNYANNISYIEAIKQVLGEDKFPQLSHLTRITREAITHLGLSQDQIEQIISLKQELFKKEYLYATSLYNTCSVLFSHHEDNPCYIVTAADKNRATAMINKTYDCFRLSEYVKGGLFVESNDKYLDLPEKLGVSAENIILYEDDECAIKSALNAGIPQENIVNVRGNQLDMFLIWKNIYLSQTCLAYHSLLYTRFRHYYNPDFINAIKNTFGYDSITSLAPAVQELKKYVKYAIRCIFARHKFNELTIVTIPRAKADKTYQPNQLLFRTSISQVIGELVGEGLPIIDGTQYLIRHTNTKTTHLGDTMQNDGEMPYPGITRATCYISPLIKGKSLLLIDDIYTKYTNIDEDAIQALLDAGAEKVIFYAIAKTLKH